MSSSQGVPTRTSIQILWSVAAGVLAFIGSEKAYAAFDYRDTLEKVVAPPDEIDFTNGNILALSVGDQEAYDNNLYRLPTNVTDLAALGIGTGSREDHINTSTAALDGAWSLGKQVVVLDVQVADNRYAQNTDLNNVSSIDKVVWDWQIASALSGQLGADYLRTQAGFVNTTIYTRNIVDQAEYFGGRIEDQRY
jgi:hypothetical protein